MKISDLEKKYSRKIDFLDLELIIAHALKKPREFVLTHPEHKLTSNQELGIMNYAKRRMQGEPLAYILGHKEFFGLDFAVNKHTLVPRPETELLVEEALKELGTKNHRLKTSIIDIGTGSGNIIISVAKSVSSKNKFIAIDISGEALQVAKRNAKFHKVAKKIKFLRGDLLKPILKANPPTGGLKAKSCIILANLPYLDLGWKNLLKSSETRGLKFEPHIALYAGKDGLDLYRRLAEQLKPLTTDHQSSITVFCEIGQRQIPGMRKIFSFVPKIDFKKDLSGRARVAKMTL